MAKEDYFTTRYDYNLMIMKSPKPATDNRFKWTLCIVTNSELDFLRYCGVHFENGGRQKFFNVGNQFGTSLSTHISNFDDIGQCWIFAVLWWPFWKWRPVEIIQCRESIRDIIIYSHIKFWWYRTMLIFYPPFVCRVLAAILKMADILKILKTQNCSSIWWPITMSNFMSLSLSS